MPLLWQTVAAESPSWGSPLHGERHANRVAATGLQLASLTPGADPAVAFCFGLLHDARRLNDGGDPEHGPRAADYATELHARGILELDRDQLATLLPVLRFHTRGTCNGEPTAACCLDADRLNLQRLGIAPKPSLLSTEAAAELVTWTRETLDEFVPWRLLAATAGYGFRLAA